MRKVIILLALFGLLAGMQVTAQSKSIITVKNSGIDNGVVVLMVHQTATSQVAESFSLQCNKGMADCKVLEPGSYMMVRLPKNWGMYDCTCVQLYASTADPASGAKLGEYCLIDN
jgi:hypothetical protein